MTSWDDILLAGSVQFNTHNFDIFNQIFSTSEAMVDSLHSILS